MSKAVKIFVVYILFLLLCSFIFNWFKIGSDFHNIPTTLYQLKLIIIPTIVGGLIALRMLVPAKLFKIFTIVYFSLWLLRYIILFAAKHIGEITLSGKVYHVDLIVANYYRTASRLETPLPFILFWLIYYCYTIIDKSNKTN